jgi:hypothetical protein
MEEYPYQNLQIEDLLGETWRAIHGFEDYYEVSNLGRIKSLDRHVPHPRLYQQFVKGRILKQKKQGNLNKKIGDEMLYLQVSLSLDGKMYVYNVRRLVYSAFVKKLNHADDALYVINISGDGLDNRLSNLTVATHSEKQKRVIIRDRMENTLKTIDRSNWAKNKARQIAVKQYTMDDVLIATFESITEAHQATKIDPKGISHTARGLYKQWGGFKWKFA